MTEWDHEEDKFAGTFVANLSKDLSDEVKKEVIKAASDNLKGDRSVIRIVLIVAMILSFFLILDVTWPSDSSFFSVEFAGFTLKGTIGIAILAAAFIWAYFAGKNSSSKLHSK